MNLDVVKKELLNIFNNNILFDEPMKNHTSFKVGGPADILVIPENKEQLISAIRICNDQSVPFMIIGNGSNLLVKDGGIRGVVIKTSHLNKVWAEGDRIFAECGATLAKASAEALKNSLKGMEFASGIPGSVGGAIFMNAGAYGGEIKDIVEKVTAVDFNGNIINLSNEDLKFAYRSCIVQKEKLIVLEVEFKLSKGNYDEIKALMEDLNKRRSDKQPLNYPSAGSVFKRPEGYFAGKLIEDAGLKGISIGGAMVSEKHAGFIINYNNATADDVLKLIKKVQDVVLDKFGVKLETEVKIVGE
ncbi:UDP-N-acetylenolpyruvoylglucosamine reductase [Caloramator mitchellensis]|uniref:UDP-N-acetylenolpyruvoylglucosamine reductase n=1 Tax=Caloramator mitchellensis TaxID=908809 RepID=A0A0R3K0R6_CALMK|nr:UDP-N-acetylmuramate dehydrogenase [Caloramator mitchellensis]KRQ87102.1 UDP-N-acetylenolpyruvoylglucosamine reductase [Caloramator mitchellensis]